MSNKISLMIVIHSLQGGGAERVLVNLLKGLSRDEFEITLVLYEDRRAYQLPENIQLRVLGIPAGRNLFSLGTGFLKKILALTRLITAQRPDLVFSLLSSTNAATILATRAAGTAARIAVSEHTFPSVNLANERFGSITARIVRLLYPRADRIIAVSRGIRDDLQRSFGIHEELLQVIYNPFDLDEISRLGKERIEHPWFSPADSGQLPVIVSAGRLTKQKNYPLLLRGFALTSKIFPCRLVILGEGPDRVPLERLIAELGLEHKVLLAGFQQNPFAWIAKAAVFALSSLYEGFPMVLVEAMALGIPVVSTDCPSGPAELITQDVNGLLIPLNNEEALSRALLRILSDRALSSALSEGGRKRAEDFGVSRISEEYRHMFRKLLV